MQSFKLRSGPSCRYRCRRHHPLALSLALASILLAACGTKTPLMLPADAVTPPLFESFGSGSSSPAAQTKDHNKPAQATEASTPSP